MLDSVGIRREAARSLGRLLPNLQREFADSLQTPAWLAFMDRLNENFEDLFGYLVDLYGDQYDFFYHLEQILIMMGQMWLARPDALHDLDAQREKNPTWHQSEQMLGGVCYVDLFAGDLKGLQAKIPYFKELGLTYLHLMPCYLSPAGENDGGYAVSDYRQVDPKLGVMQDLEDLAVGLRAEGISLVLDFVFNHTSDEHRWAERALAGVPEYQEYYFMFADRAQADEYDRHLREIFPDVRRGNFSYRPEVDKWVWTTFNNFQWDLNYTNPVVFRKMAQEMLTLANAGAEVLRLDALAFIWKQKGTVSESMPQAHTLVRAFNRVARIAAPTLLFKSEAIVHPDEVVRYIGAEECQLSYNPLLMALMWESLATREVRLLFKSLSHRFQIPAQASWVNYIRCHDDIGWTFDDTDAQQLGINGYDHRRFLNSFYTGRFPGSFARGLPFQENPATGDARISGSLASLAGLERAMQMGDAAEIELAIRRILLLHSIILSIGGIPLIYLNDETGVINDYGFREDAAKGHDSRWVHRPRTDWARNERRTDMETVEGRIYSALGKLIHLRKIYVGFGGNDMQVINLGNGHVFGYVRANQGQRVLVLASFTEREQVISANELRLRGLGYAFT
ncbi:MAG: alpha-amylase family protein, partial [Caldilineaceae bacterium]|nr:alpha-amylase family protein [Caldilineaceae bacterium]